MKENIFAFTETDYQPEYYPGYVNLNQDHEGSITLTVRSRGNYEASSIKMSAGEINRLCQQWTDFRKIGYSVCREGAQKRIKVD
jgi:hypothetical protein